MKKILKATALLASMSIMLTGCFGILDVLDDDYDETAETIETTAPPLLHSTAPEDDDGNDVTAEPADFKYSGTRISVVNGEINIERRTRDHEVDMQGDKWTILLYLCGTDLETNNGAATNDILEAIEGKYTDDVNLIIQSGGTYAWNNNVMDADFIQRFEMINGNIELVDQEKLQNMGSSETLADFIEWGAENYPAENMGLIFWNHGGGSISGVCFDEMYDSDSLSLREIDAALNSSFDSMSERFEFIGFDACLMGTLETANILVPYAKYMYGSQELEPGNGWDYEAIFDHLAKDPEADGASLGKAICDSYKKHCADYGSDSISTLSVTDLTKIDALIESFNTTAQEMNNSDSFNSIARAITYADNFGGNNRSEGYTNMVDLGEILEGIEDYCPSASDTLNKLDDAIFYSISGSQHRNAGGLSVYYPLSVQGSVELSTFADICPSTEYLAFVDSVAYGTTGGSISDYDNDALTFDILDIWDINFDFGDYETNCDDYAGLDTSTIPVSDVYFDDEGIYTVAVEDFSNFSYATCTLFMWDDSDSTYIYLGEDDEVYIDFDTGIITDNFDGTWVSLDDGTILPIEIVTTNEDFSIYTCSVLHNGEVTNLRIEYDWNAEEWNVIGLWAGIDENGMADRDIVELQNGDVIEPIFYYTNYSDIEDYFVSGEYVVNGDVDIIYEMLPDAEYIYSITLYDIYGNCYYAPEVTFEIEGEDFWYYPDELDNEDLGGLFDDAINNIIWGDLDQDDDEYDDSYSNVWNDLLGW